MSYVITEIPEHVSNVFGGKVNSNWGCVRLLLKCIQYIQVYYPYKGCVYELMKAHERSNLIKYILVRDKAPRRIYLYYSCDKYVSITHPFTLKYNDSSETIDLYLHNVYIESKIISEMISMIEVHQKRMTNSNIKSASLLEMYTEWGELEYSEDAFYVMEYLLSYEFGYIRHDYAPEDAKGHKHPACHFDINYSKDAGYKYGLQKMLTRMQFESMFEPTSDCFYISFPDKKIECKLNRIMKERNKKRRCRRC